MLKVVALVGPSGGGKSSIVKLIQHFYSPASGHVRFDGRDVGVYSPKWLRRRVAIVNQVPPGLLLLLPCCGSMDFEVCSLTKRPSLRQRSTFPDWAASLGGC